MKKCIGFKNTSIFERLVLYLRTEKCVHFKNTNRLILHPKVEKCMYFKNSSILERPL
jgi:hypothetical protein